MEQRQSNTEAHSQTGFTPVPDVVFDELLPDLGGAELKVLMYIMRRTYGWQKQQDNISISQLVGGIVREDGTVVDRGTGLTRKTAIRAVGSLRDRGLIWKTWNYSDRRGDMANTYTLTLPKPCSRSDISGEGKNDTPRVEKIPSQETTRQNTKDSYSVVGEEPPTTGRMKDREKTGSPDSLETTGSPLSRNSAQKNQRDSEARLHIVKSDSALERMQKLSRVMNGREFVTFLFASVRESYREELPAIVDQLGSNWKAMVRQFNPSIEEAAKIAEETAQCLYSPQRSVKGLVERGVLDPAKFTPDEDRRLSRKCTGTDSPGPEGTEEGSAPTEPSPADLEAVRRVLAEPESEAGELARKYLEDDQDYVLLREVVRAVNREAFGAEFDEYDLGLMLQNRILPEMKQSEGQGEAVAM